MPAPAWTAPRRQATQDSGAPRPPHPGARDSWQGAGPFPAGGRQRRAPVPCRLRRRGGGRGASPGFHLLLPHRGARSLSAPVCPSRSLRPLLHGSEERGEEVPAEPERVGGCWSRFVSVSPEPGPPRDAADVTVRRSPGAGRSSPRTSCLSGFGPRQCRDAGLASCCGAGSSRVIRVISVIVIISLFPCGSVSLHHFQTSPL